MIERVSITTFDDVNWTMTNKVLLMSAAHALYHRLWPQGQLGDDDLLSKVSDWSFQTIERSVDVVCVDEDLSLVEDGPHESFLALRGDVGDALVGEMREERRDGEIEPRDSLENCGNDPTASHCHSTPTVHLQIFVPVVRFVHVPVPLFIPQPPFNTTWTPWFPFPFVR